MINKLKTISKKAQEEMVGFAVIIVLVSVVLVIFLGLYIREPPKSNLESYEVANFMQALMFSTTNCSTTRGGYLQIKELAKACSYNEKCEDKKNSCDVLDFTLNDILRKSWRVGPDAPYSGYELNISMQGNEILHIKEGNISREYRSSPSLGDNPKLDFTVYIR